ncbi:hypothetical protein H2O73_14370 [Vibrio sp. 404]|uniref:Lipopolysaccharide biosynthesis protein n=1 Tax=Vibrio marinisediminis TaxID=2758441 RepID=A0A7W2FSN4_9VIBR|nr:hypothetical protein [Vibrio marinisediminis]MBA5763544.1 hypothetical protein [Vibrio marinisediminis]
MSKGGAIREMLLYGVALLLLKGASLITLPVMTHFLSVEQIGQLELIAVTQVFFALLVSLSMHENLYRFIAVAKDKFERKLMTNQLYCSAILLSICLLILLTMVYGFIDRVLQLSMPSSYFTQSQILLMVSVLAIQAALEISLAWLRLQDKAEVFFKLSLFCTFLQVSLVLIVVNTIPSVTAVLAVGVFCAFVQLMILHHYNQFNWQLLSINQLKLYLRYCLPIMCSALIAFGLNGGERWILVQTGSIELLAQYAIALKFALAVGILLQPFHMWWMPKRFEYWQNRGARLTASISQIGMVYAALLTILVVWGGKLFITLYLPDQYLLAAKMVTIATVAMLFKELTELCNIGLLKTHQTKKLLTINLTVTLLALTMVAIAVQLYPHYSIWLVGCGIAFAQIVRCTVILFYSQRLAHLPYHGSGMVLFLVLTLIFVATTWTINSPIMSLLFAAGQIALLLTFAHNYKLIDFPYQQVRKVLQRLSV